MSTTRLDRRLVSLTAPESFAAEQYQGLRFGVERQLRARSAQVLAVTSPGSGDGKTVTAVNLAAALTRGSDARVLLVDADLRRPSIATQLGLPGGGRGLGQVLAGEVADLEEVTQRIETPPLAVVPAGVPGVAVSRVLRAPRLGVLLQQAREHYDFVVVDTPPLLPVFDAALLARAADAVLVVVAARRTPRKLLAEALNLLDPSKVLGLVLNRDDRPLFGYYESYYRSYLTDRFQGTSGG